MLTRALKKIAKEKIERTGKLNLGNSGLIELPEELFELVWLEELILGPEYESIETYLVEEDIEDIENQENREEINSIIKGENLTRLSFFKNLKILSCVGRGIKDISFVKDLKKIENLDLGSNQIFDISPLKHLTKIKYLTLYANKIEDISPIQELSNLILLNLGGNKIMNSSIIKKFSKLSVLQLWDTEIRDFDFLKNLTQLEFLNINDNQNIEDFSFLKQLKQLKSLYIKSTDFNTGSILDNLKLKTLRIGGNPMIKDFSFLSNMQDLISLSVSKNNLSNISFLKPLKNLQFLDLRDNNISEISAIKNLTKLQTLRLQENKIYNITDLYDLILDNRMRVTLHEMQFNNVIGLNNNPIIIPPINIVKQGNEAIINYLNQIKKQGGTEPLYEAKILIVGEAGAGKTSLLEKIKNSNYEIPRPEGMVEKETVGINVYKDWEFPYAKNPNINFTSSIWDFGGQEIQYMTHQFFLTSQSLYILVADDRKENTKFPYWFEAVHLFSEDEHKRRSPILVVLNQKEKGETTFNYDHKKYTEKYPDLKIRMLDVDFSNNEDGKLEIITNEIKRMLCELPHVGMELPKQWRHIREALQKIKTPYINLRQFQKICHDRGVSIKADQDLISTYLHRLGYIIHFQEVRELRDFIILEAKWALKAIYILLLHKKVDLAGGRFSDNLVDELWADYSNEQKNVLLNLMKGNRFDLIYPIEGNPGHYITPLMLSEVQPAIEWNSENSLRFRYKYNFMPEGVITRLIVRKSASIHSVDKKAWVWKKGVVLKYQDCLMRIIEDPFPKQIIDIEITGNLMNRKNALAWVRGEVSEIHEWFKNVEVEELVPCNCQRCSEEKVIHFFDYKVLQKRLYKNRPEYCKLSDEEVNPRKLLEGVFSRKDIEVVKSASGLFNNEVIFRGDRGLEVLENFQSKDEQSIESPNLSNELLNPSKSPFYKEWWFTYLAAAFGVAVFAGLFGMWFLGRHFLDGFMIFLPITSLVLFGFGNPENRLFRAGFFALSAAISSLLLNMEGTFNWKGKLFGSDADINIQWLDELGWLISLALLSLSAFLFYLWDRKKK